LDGKVAVITGANTGIGKETARDLSRRGADVVMACRDMEKAQKVADEIKSETKGEVTAIKLNLASMESIRSAAEELKSRHSKIHFLINNAGVMMCPQWKTDDGFEMQLGVNHLGHFLWTLLLLDTIKQSAPARIINLSSLAHTRGRIHFDDLMLEKNYDPTKSYAQSKLANILFTKELARRLEGSGVVTVAVHPGIVKTDLGRHLSETSLFMNMFAKSADFFNVLKTAEMGAQTTIHCATDESIVNQNGLYFSDCRKKQPARQAEDMEAARRLWEKSEQLVQMKL